MRARNRSKTSSWRWRLRRGPGASLRSRSSRALRNASGDEYVRFDTRNSSEWLQHPRDLRELSASDEAACEGLLGGLTQQVWREPVTGALIQGARRSGDRNGPNPRARLVRQVGVVKEHVFGNGEPSPSPRSRQCQVGTRRERIGQTMKRERRLMRKDSSALGPEPHGGELFVLDVRKVNEAVDATALVHDSTGLEVLLEQLRRVARLGSLTCREEPRLGARHLEECVPVGRRLHAPRLTVGLSSRNEQSSTH